MARRYGEWAGNSKGYPEHPERCVETVWPGSGYISAQCSRKRGYGPNGEYCKQHALRFEVLETPKQGKTNG